MLENITAEKIVDELYNPLEKGCIVIKDFLKKEFLYELQEEVKKGKYVISPKEYGKAKQELETCYVSEKIEEFPHTKKLLENYKKIVNEIGKKANFDELPMHILMQKYLKGSIGITPHLDEACYRNLISIFVIEGSAQFCVCSDRNGKNSVEIESKPGNLILLRAPRNTSENKIRPMHYVGNVAEERYTIVMRYKWTG